jgi:hypothetical protein
VKQAHRQVSHYRGPATCAATTRARDRGGEDPDCGLRLYSSLGQGSGSPVGRDGGQTEATVTKQLPPLTADEVDKMYCELVKIHSIAAHN